MGIAIISPSRDTTVWVKNIRKLDKNIEIQVFPDIQDYLSVDAVILWQHPKGILDKFPNLKLICSMGAGVDHILSDHSIKKSISITRIVDEKLTFSMTNYVLMGILNFHRQIDRYKSDQKNKIWDMSNPEIPIVVGIMGVGELGGDVIQKLQLLGINVAGLGYSPKENLTYPYFDKSRTAEFLSAINVLVCMLPLTPDTEGVLNKDLFQKCKKGTYLINVARGKHLVEEDLIPAIENGYLSGALLDVFHQEPLPQDHPFWNREEITITPHIASVTNPDAAAPQIIENYNRIIHQKPLLNQIDRNKGY